MGATLYKRVLARVGFAFSMLLLVSCSVTPAEESDSETPITLRVNAAHFMSNMPVFIADEEGYFAEQGLEIEFSGFSTRELIPSIVDGEIDVAAGQINIAMLNAMARGSHLALVADKGHYDPSDCGWDGLVVGSDLIEGGLLDDPAGIEGMRVSHREVSIEGYVLNEFLKSVGLTYQDIEPVDIPTPSEVEALAEGSVEIVAGSEPWITRMVREENGVLWMPGSEVVPDFQAAIILYGPSILEDNPEAGRRFMVAYLKGVRQYNQGKTDRNLEIMSKVTELERDILEEVCLATMHDDGQINTQSVLDFQSWAAGNGSLDEVVPEDVFWDPSFLEYANEVLESEAE